MTNQAVPSMKCTICQAEVTAETYAAHIQSAHATPPPAQTPLESANSEWSASTDEIIVPKLSSEFWSPGVRVIGKLDGYRELTFRDNSGATRTGIAYRLILDSPVKVSGEDESIIELPPLTGIVAALKALKLKGYQPEKGDVWDVKCTDITKAKREGFSDSPTFTVRATRPKF